MADPLRFRIRAGRNGTLRLRDNFGGRTPEWRDKSMVKSGPDFITTVKAGEIIEASLPKPPERSPAPANVAEPVVIPARSS